MSDKPDHTPGEAQAPHPTPPEIARQTTSDPATGPLRPSPDATLHNGPVAGASASLPSAAYPGGNTGPTEEQVKMALRKVKDPELNLNIVDLGLVYGISADEGDVQIAMTLTSPGCPSGPEITADVERAINKMPGVKSVDVQVVWSPYWTPDRIEPRVRAYLGL